MDPNPQGDRPDDGRTSRRSARAAARLRRVAYHEAGHAVVAFRLHRGIERVSIEPHTEIDALGHVRLAQTEEESEEWVHPRTRRALDEEHIVMRHAGAIAERRATDSGHRRNVAGPDREIIVDLLLDLDGSGELATKHDAYLRARAEQMVEDHWPMVEIVAAKLLDKGQIGQNDLIAAHQELIGPAPDLVAPDRPVTP